MRITYVGGAIEQAQAESSRLGGGEPAKAEAAKAEPSKAKPEPATAEAEPSKAEG